MTNLLEDQLISTSSLVNFGRAQRTRDLARLDHTIHGEYYFDRQGWVRYAEGHETEQGKRLIDRKGWRRIDRSPRPPLLEEHEQRYYAFFRAGLAYLMPPEQVVAHNWHRNPPTILTCRLGYDEYDHPAHERSCYGQPQFSQMENVVVYDAECSICERRHSSIKSQAAAENMVKKHMEVQHREHLQNRALVAGLAQAIAPLVQSGGGLSAEQFAALLQAVQNRPIPNHEPAGDVVEEDTDERGDHVEPHQGAPETSKSSEGIPEGEGVVRRPRKPTQQEE